MHYVEVAVEDRAVKAGSLTYSSVEAVAIGSIVRVQVRNKKMNAVVLKHVNKPSFATKPLIEVIEPAAIPAHLISFAKWIAEYYATELPSVIQLLIPRGAHKQRRAASKKQTAISRRSTEHLKLTTEQHKALQTIGSSGTHLLHGVTGSGKSRVYIELAKLQQQAGKGSIILVPEIGLTSQMVADVKQSLQDVFVIHSQLSEPQRHKLWLQILEAKAPVVVGPRSALFSPLQRLGLIVVDEAHETSYKQDQSPRYHAVRGASQLARLTTAILILGSATPRVEDYYLAQQTKTPLLRMSQPVTADAPVDIAVVDLKNRDNFAKQKGGILSDKLLDAIRSSLEAKQQTLLFHNRRGSSTMVVCTNCGWLAECPNCQLPLTHHADWQLLVCHICNYQRSILTSCPECKQPELRYKGFGTKQIVSEIQKHFPSARVQRFDSDVGKDDRLQDHYQAVYNGDIDIIVGTQMVAKGLDLPSLQTVGVVLADTALYLPDFSANERAFQLLYQVIGRVGRHQAGSVIVQTYTPEHTAIQAAVSRDYDSFYTNEIQQRRVMLYPPFVHLLQLSAQRASQKAAMDTTGKLARIIKVDYPGVQVLGPSPAFHERTAKGYRWQIVVKAKQRGQLIDIVRSLPANWQFDIDPVNLL